MAFDDDDTIEMEAVDSLSARCFEETGIEISALTHRGSVRTTNEDQYAVVRRTRRGEVLGSSILDVEMATSEERAWLLIVADGMGGHVSGEVASATTVRTVVSFADSLGSWIMRRTDDVADELSSRIALYANAIQKELQEQADYNPQLSGMGTTLTAAYLYGRDGVIVNVGDSRSYLIRSGNIMQITQDHTVAQELQNAGHAPEITKPFQNMLTRCFTTKSDPVHVDMFRISLVDGDRLMLCSDGLTDLVSDADILSAVTAASSTKEACEELVAKALNAGGRDNITVIVAGV